MDFKASANEYYEDDRINLKDTCESEKFDGIRKILSKK